MWPRNVRVQVVHGPRHMRSKRGGQGRQVYKGLGKGFRSRGLEVRKVFFRVSCLVGLVLRLYSEEFRV